MRLYPYSQGVVTPIGTVVTAKTGGGGGGGGGRGGSGQQVKGYFCH